MRRRCEIQLRLTSGCCCWQTHARPNNTGTHTHSLRQQTKCSQQDRGCSRLCRWNRDTSTRAGTCWWRDQIVWTDPPRQRRRPEALLLLTGRTCDKNTEGWHFRRSVESRREECFSASSEGFGKLPVTSWARKSDSNVWQSRKATKGNLHWEGNYQETSLVEQVEDREWRDNVTEGDGI